MADERISEYVDREAAGSDTEFMLAQLNAIEDAYKRVNGIRINIGKDNSFAAAAEDAKKLKAGTDELSLSVTQYGKTVDDNARLQSKMNAATSDAAKENAQLKLQLAQSTAELKAQAKEALGLNDAYDKLKIQYAAAAKEAKNLQVIASQTNNQQDIAAADKATKNAKALHDQLFAVEQAVGQSQRNVGNYTGALKILEGALGEASTRMQTLAESNRSNTEEYANAAKEVSLLTQLVDQQAGGFASVTQEIRSTERALRTMHASTLEGTAAFKALQESTAEAARSQKDFEQQQKILEAEVPLLQGITLAAKGLAGAYAVGAGAVALFAEGDEKAQKELAKLVAIMTILQGLQEAYNLAQNAGTIITVIRTGIEKGAAAVKGVFAGATKAATVASTEFTAAEATQIPVLGANATAMEVLAVATFGEAAALETVGTAAVATTTAISATGIGAAILVAAAAIFVLVEKIQQWNHENELSIKQQGELADAVKAANEAIISQADFIDKLDDSTARYYRNQLTLSKAAGDSRDKQFSLERGLNAAEKQAAQDRINELGATNEQQAKLAGTISQLNLRRQAAIDIQNELLAIPTGKLTSDEERNLKAATDNIELYTKQIASLQPLFEAGAKARSDFFASGLKEDEQSIEEKKFAQDEQRKIILESAKLEAEIIKSKNSIILNSDRTTQEQKIRALRSTLDQELKVAAEEKNAVLTDNSSTPAARLIAQRTFDEQKKVLTAKLLDDEFKLRESYRLRDLQADYNMENLKVKQLQASNDVIVKDTTRSLEDRLEAYKRFVTAEKIVIENELEERLKAAGFSDAEVEAVKRGEEVRVKGKTITLEELKNLEATYYDQLSQLAVKSGKDIYDITISWAHKLQTDIDTLNKGTLQNVTAATEEYSRKVIALNERLGSGGISAASYDLAKTMLSLQQKINLEKARSLDIDQQVANEAGVTSRLKAEESATQEELLNAQFAGDAAAIAESQKKYDAIIEQEKESGAILKELQKKRADQSLAISQAEADLQKVIAQQKANDLKAIEQASVDFVKQLGDQVFQNRVNDIQNEIDLNNLKAQQQIDAENRSADSAQEKADKITAINIKAQNDEKALQAEQRKEKQKQGQFDKLFTIAEIVFNTQRAISGYYASMSVLGAVGLAAASAFALRQEILGAIEVATILATPVPTYRYGTGDYPGGVGEWGHGRQEMAVTPAGDLILSGTTPSLINFPEHTIIYPDAADMLGNMILKHSEVPQKIHAPAIDLERFTSRIETAIRNKHEIHIKPGFNSIMAMHKYGDSYLKWVDENTQF